MATVPPSLAVDGAANLNNVSPEMLPVQKEELLALPINTVPVLAILVHNLPSRTETYILGCGPAGTCECGKCKCDIGRTGTTCDLYLGCDGVTYTTPAQLPQLDACGVCNGTNSTCLGCDGIPFGLQLDHCGVCGGDGRSCMDGCGYNSDCQTCIKDDKCQWCYSAQFCADKVHVYECPDNNYVTTADRCVQSKNITFWPFFNCFLVLGLTVAQASGVGAGVIAAIAIGGAAFAGAAIFGGKKGYDAYKKHRNNMSGAQSNPMYNDSGRSGQNPMYEMNNRN